MLPRIESNLCFWTCDFTVLILLEYFIVVYISSVINWLIQKSMSALIQPHLRSYILYKWLMPVVDLHGSSQILDASQTLLVYIFLRFHAVLGAYSIWYWLTDDTKIFWIQSWMLWFFYILTAYQWTDTAVRWIKQTLSVWLSFQGR